MSVERFYAVAPIEMVDVRDNEAQGTWTMSGYATVFNSRGTIYDNKFERMTVQIDPHAFDRLFSEQDFTSPEGVVHFNRGHDPNTSVAATDVPAGQPGSLKLSVDQNGLRFLAKVSRDDPDGIALAAKMRAGVVKQASFAFVAAREKFSYPDEGDDRDLIDRYISEIKQIYDVCATSRGVMAQTISQLESYAKLLGQPSQGDHRHQPDLGEGKSTSPVMGGSQDITPPRSAWSLDLDAVLARGERLQPITADLTERNRDVRPEPDAAGE